MTDEEIKPLYWQPTPGIGYTVTRRPDGGMHLSFTDLSPVTIAHWRNFALQHLYDSDRLTRNLYDLRQLESIPEEAIKAAVEVNNDPNVRNIRLAAVVNYPAARAALQQIADLTIPGGVEMEIFDNIDAAIAWLDRPLTQLI